MLTVSIPEMATMGPQAWSTCNGDADVTDGVARWSEYDQWSMEDYQQFQFQASYNAWSPEAHSSLEPAYSMSENVLAEDHLQEPLKMPISCADSKVPLTAFASPLRVPLPKPLALGEEPSELPDLPPGLEEFFMELTCEESPEESRPDEKKQTVPPLHGFPTSGALVPVTAANPRKSELPTLAIPCEDHAPQGISIRSTEVGKLIQWEISSFQGKIQANNGRPVVSPPFTACGLSNLRLMVTVDTRDLAKGKSAKGKNSTKGATKNGPLSGSLKLKADCLAGGATVLKFNLSVGAAKVGPFAFDFSQQAVHGPEDFGVDWMAHVDNNTGNMRVGVELLEVHQQEN